VLIGSGGTFVEDSFNFRSAKVQFSFEPDTDMTGMKTFPDNRFFSNNSQNHVVT